MLTNKVILAVFLGTERTRRATIFAARVRGRICGGDVGEHPLVGTVARGKFCGGDGSETDGATATTNRDCDLHV